MQGVCRVKDQCPAGVHGLGLTAVDDLGGEQPGAGVPVVMVVGVVDSGSPGMSVGQSAARS